MGNAYSLDVPDVFYRPANPISAFLQSKNESDARLEEQRRHEAEQRQKQEALAYQRQRQGMLDQQDSDQRRQKAIEQLSMLVDNGRVPEAQALAAAHNLPFQPGGVGLAPMAEGQRAPQLQMPGQGQFDPAAPPPSFRLPGMQLREPGQPEAPPPQQPLRIPGVNARMQAAPPPPDESPAPPDLGGYARAFLGQKPPAPAPDGLADYPTELETTVRKPTTTVNGQTVELDPNGAADRADRNADREARKQGEIQGSVAEREAAKQARLFEQQRAMQEDRQAGAIALKKTPRGGAGAGGDGMKTSDRRGYNTGAAGLLNQELQRDDYRQLKTDISDTQLMIKGLESDSPAAQKRALGIWAKQASGPGAVQQSERDEFVNSIGGKDEQLKAMALRWLSNGEAPPEQRKIFAAAARNIMLRHQQERMSEIQQSVGNLFATHPDPQMQKYSGWAKGAVGQQLGGAGAAGAAKKKMVMVNGQLMVDDGNP